MIFTQLQYLLQNSMSKPSQFKRRHLVVSSFILLLMLQFLTCFATGDLDINSAHDVRSSLRHSNDFHLRGRFHFNSLKDEQSNRGRYDTKPQQNLQSLDIGEEIQHRSVEANNISTIFLSPSSTFQIIMSIILAILILLQLYVFVSFLRNRSKRVLEFAQPDAICIFVACSIIATASCYLYVFVSSSLTCAIREPLLFVSISLMGATVAGRAWRISTLVNNPLLTAGKNSQSSDVSKIEQSRQQMLRIISVLSGFDCSATIEACRRRKSSNVNEGGEEEKRSSPLRVKVTFVQMTRAAFFMILPQLFWQIVVLSTPALRSSRELASNAYLYHDGNQMMTMEQYQCRSSVGLWPHSVSVFLALCSYVIAYVLNTRPKSELDLLPEMIDEKAQLEQSFYIFARVIAVSGPVIVLTYKNNPEAKVYSAICALLVLPLACCYNIAYLKLNAIKHDVPKQQAHDSSQSRLSRGKKAGKPTSVLRIAKMYYMIGRPEETAELVDETLGLYQSNAGNHEGGKEEVALGFTKKGLQALNEDELELIIRLLKLKYNALERLEGLSGYPKRAKMNIDTIKLFENSPAARKMKDTSFMFPIYNLAGENIKSGLIDGDDDFSLEMELLTHCCREAQLQSYHYARSVANLAELYGRVGMPDEAFKYFNIMEAVYMKQEHPELLADAYAIDRCAVCYASSALWYLQKGEINNAIERCNYVIDHILPQYDKSDILGLYLVFVPLCRVLKWNGEAGKALEAYTKFMPDAANTHWAVGSLQKPTILLLQICEGSSYHYNEGLMSQDVETALSIEVTEAQDLYLSNYGWSMNTLAAELCMLLASRLDAGSASREKLIDRGIRMARIAQERTTPSNGKVKHISAVEANKDIYKKLLQLTNRTANVDDDIVENEDFNDPNDTKNNRSSATLNVSESSTPSLSASFANKLKPSMSAARLEGTAGLGGVSAPLSQISVASKRKEISSLESSCSTKRPSSLQSSATIQEDLSKHSHE